MKRVLRKTNAHTQANLVRIVLSGPLARWSDIAFVANHPVDDAAHFVHPDRPRRFIDTLDTRVHDRLNVGPRHLYQR